MSATSRADGRWKLDRTTPLVDARETERVPVFISSTYRVVDCQLIQSITLA